MLLSGGQGLDAVIFVVVGVVVVITVAVGFVGRSGGRRGGEESGEVGIVFHDFFQGLNRRVAEVEGGVIFRV